jgi:hypothetical protein
MELIPRRRLIERLTPALRDALSGILLGKNAVVVRVDVFPDDLELACRR